MINARYCEGGSLKDTVTSFGCMAEPLVSGFIYQILVGLAYLHEEGVIHRDIKSANILTTKSGLVKLADFGIAIRLGKDKAQFAGSPYWSTVIK